MTTPPPDGSQPPAYTPPPAYGQQPSYGQQPAGSPYSSYAAAPPPAPQYAAPPASRPGRTLGIVAFILSFFTTLIALILGIVALVQSKRAGQKNGFAVAAIIISSVLTVIGIIVAIAIVASFGAMANDILTNCSSGGSGYVVIWGQEVPCSQIDTGR